MEKKFGQRPDVLESIRRNIAAAEKERRELRFIYTYNDFTKGNVRVLQNAEFIEGLQGYLLTDPAHKKEERMRLYRSLGEAALDDESSMRERALTLMSTAMEFHFARKEQDYLAVLLQELAGWLEQETDPSPGFEALLQKIGKVLQWLMANEFWAEAEPLVLLLARIQTGELKKNNAIRSLAAAILRGLEKKSIVERLTDGYLRSDERQQLYRELLQAIGNKAVVYLLGRVIHGQDKEERLALVKLIAGFGAIAIPALEECLKLDPPWAVIRNVIAIVSAIGSEANYPLIERYMDHPDERVQHELINCVLTLGGEKMRGRLIRGLGLVQDRSKLHILRLLGQETTGDEPALEAILELAEQRCTGSPRGQEDLVLAVVATLKAYPSGRSIRQLERMREEYARHRGTERLLLHLDETLKTVRPKVRHQLQDVGGDPEAVSFDNDPMLQRLTQEKIRKIEEEVRSLVRAGDTRQAGQLIFNQAIAAAKARDFSVAGLLRDRLLEINPMALAEVVQLGEFIDEQKSASITSHHLEIWSELYEEMTTEEFNELYYSLRPESYHKDEVVVRSGETDSSLYFLNSGYVSLGCLIGGKETFLKRVNPGNILGGEQFFSPSVWTVTLRALGEIQVHVLDHAVLRKIAENHPGIEEKLRRYCQKYAKVPELLKMSGDDRREYPRYSANLQTSNVLLDPYGGKGKKNFKGELLDISRQGIAFAIRISSMEAARLLLGRHIETTILIGDEELPQQHGIIVGVRLHDPLSQNFSVHVKLSTRMDDWSFSRARAAGRA